MSNRCHNFKQVFIAIDQLVLCLFGLFLSIFNPKIKVWSDWTISAQSYRLDKKGYWYGKVMRFVIDMLFYPFEKNHCELSFNSEINREHLPTDILKK